MDQFIIPISSLKKLIFVFFENYRVILGNYNSSTRPTSHFTIEYTHLLLQTQFYINKTHIFCVNTAYSINT